MAADDSFSVVNSKRLASTMYLRELFPNIKANRLRSLLRLVDDDNVKAAAVLDITLDPKSTGYGRVCLPNIKGGCDDLGCTVCRSRFWPI